MMDKAWKTCLAYRMLQQGDRVAVGVSGGMDSVALLDFLLDCRERLDLEIIVCHVNHNLRGAESDRDEDFVRELCRRRRVDFRLRSLDAAVLAWAAGQSVETAARDARYAFFAEIAGEEGKIATAHTAADNLETVLWNLVRGSGLRGLCGIPPVRDRIIRPFIACTRVEIEQYCADQGLDYVMDSTNLTDDYARNRLRHRVVPVLLEENPALIRNTAGLTRRLRDDADYLDAQTARAVEELCREGGYCRAGLLALPPALSGRALLRIIEAHTTPTARLIELCRDILTAGCGAQELRPGVCFFADTDIAGVRCVEAPREAFELTAQRPAPGQTIELWAEDRLVRLSVQTIPANYCEKFYKSPLKNTLDYDKLVDTFVLRDRRDGDRLAPVGRGVTKTLKKLFQEEAVAPAQRSKRLMLCDERGLVWVEGFGIDDSRRPDSATRYLLTVEIL